MKTLIQYKGGGYDGCFWEWNYCLIGPSFFFRNIQSTGVNGIESLDGLSIYMKGRNKFYMYSVNKEGLAEFIKECNAQSVLEIIEFINAEIECEAIEGPKIYIDCLVCENDFCTFGYENEGLVLHPADYQGDGGVGIQYNSYICTECLSNQSCNYCSDWIGEDNSEDWQPCNKNDSIQSSYGPLCVYCYESIKGGGMANCKFNY